MELLKPERDYFLQYLNVLIDDLKKSLIQNNKHQDNGNISAVCWECRWLKVVEHQINEIKRVTHLIETQDGYEAISIALENLRTQTENLLKTNFELWREQSIANVQSGELTYVVYSTICFVYYTSIYDLLILYIIIILNIV